MLSRYVNTVDNTLRTVTPTLSCGYDILWNEQGSLLQLISRDVRSRQVRFHFVCLAVSALNLHFLLPVIVFFSLSNADLCTHNPCELQVFSDTIVLGLNFAG